MSKKDKEKDKKKGKRKERPKEESAFGQNKSCRKLQVKMLRKIRERRKQTLRPLSYV